MVQRRLAAMASHVCNARPPTGHEQPPLLIAAAATATAMTTGAAEQEPPIEMSEREKFLLDLSGYLVVPGFLSAEEVAALNASFDNNWHRRVLGSDNAKRHAVDQFHGMLSWPAAAAKPFRDLLAHPKLVPYLNTILGPGFRMDHSPFMLTCEAGYDGDPGGGMAVHGGGHWGNHGGIDAGLGPAYYRYANNVMRSGMLVCSFQLTDIASGDGGFGVVPGSHKVNFPMPVRIKITTPHESPWPLSRVCPATTVASTGVLCSLALLAKTLSLTRDDDDDNHDTGAWPYNRPCANQYVGKYESCRL